MCNCYGKKPGETGRSLGADGGRSTTKDADAVKERDSKKRRRPQLRWEDCVIGET